MNNAEFLKKIKAKAELNKQRRKDPRFKRTMAFLKGKGLLNTNLPIEGKTGMKLEIRDAIWAGLNVEPRIIEVLPTAIIHFQKNFYDYDKMPENLRLVVKALRDGAEVGPEFEGVAFDKLKIWANTQLKDRRTKPVSEKKHLKTFKLTLAQIEKLERLVANGKYKDQTSALVAAIEKL